MRINISGNLGDHPPAAVLAPGAAGRALQARAGIAADNPSVSESASADCTISAAGIAAFSSCDPVAADASSTLDGSGSVSTTCTNGSAPVIMLGEGPDAAGGSSDAVPLRQMASGANRPAYTLASDSRRTTVWGNTAGTGLGDTGDGTARALMLYGRVASGRKVVPAGRYTDSVVATGSF